MSSIILDPMIGVFSHGCKPLIDGINIYEFPNEHNLYFGYTYGFNDR